MKKTKKFLGLILAALLIVPLGGTVNSYADSLNIPDTALKTALSEQVNKTADTLTKDDLKSVTSLDISDKGINSIKGLEYCTNLTSLEMSYNNITDLTPLKTLTKLTDLSALDCGIKDISTLSSLSNLKYISLEYNCISDITPLMNLKKLNYASLDEQIINLDQVTTTGKVKVNYPVVDTNNSGTILIYDISDNGSYNASKKQVTWKNVKADTTLNFFFREFIIINGERAGNISGIVNVPVKAV